MLKTLKDYNSIKNLKLLPHYSVGLLPLSLDSLYTSIIPYPSSSSYISLNYLSQLPLSISMYDINSCIT